MCAGKTVEHGGPLQAVDRGLDPGPAAEPIEEGGVALVAEQLAPRLQRPAGLARQPAVSHAEGGDRLAVAERLAGPLQYPVAAFHAGIEPGGQPVRLALRAGGLPRGLVAGWRGAVPPGRFLALLAFVGLSPRFPGPVRRHPGLLGDARLLGGAACFFGPAPLFGQSRLRVPGDPFPDLPFIVPDRVRPGAERGEVGRELPFRDLPAEGVRTVEDPLFLLPQLPPARQPLFGHGTPSGLRLQAAPRVLDRAGRVEEVSDPLPIPRPALVVADKLVHRLAPLVRQIVPSGERARPLDQRAVGRRVVEDPARFLHERRRRAHEPPRLGEPDLRHRRVEPARRLVQSLPFPGHADQVGRVGAARRPHRASLFKHWLRALTPARQVIECRIGRRPVFQQ